MPRLAALLLHGVRGKRRKMVCRHGLNLLSSRSSPHTPLLGSALLRRWRTAPASAGVDSQEAAEFGVPITAIIDEKRNQRLHASDVRPVDDRPAFPGTAQQ